MHKYMIMDFNWTTKIIYELKINLKLYNSILKWHFLLQMQHHTSPNNL